MRNNKFGKKCQYEFISQERINQELEKKNLVCFFTPNVLEFFFSNKSVLFLFSVSTKRILTFAGGVSASIVAVIKFFF